MKYITNCVESTESRISSMIDSAIEVTRRTFVKNVDQHSLQALSLSLGYARHPKQGLTMAGDYMVSYYRSKFCGRPCYYLCFSSIEYIFMAENF